MPSATARIPWAEVRRAYVETDEPVKSILERFEITQAKLRHRRVVEGWPVRDSPVGKPRSPGAAAHEPAALVETLCKLTALPIATDAGAPDLPVHGRANPVPPPPLPAFAAAAAAAAATNTEPATRKQKQKAQVDKFYAAIAQDLARIDKLLAVEDLPPADAERLTRSLASIIQSYERVLELDPANRTARLTSSSRPDRSTTGSAGNNSGSGIDASGPTGAERIRREIAERLERLLEKGIAAGGPGDPVAG